MKAIKQSELNDILYSHFRDEISASKTTELINDKADEFAIKFSEWCFVYSLSKHSNSNYKELLEIYKKEKSL